MYVRQQVRVADQIRHSQLGQACLAGPEQFSRSAQLQVFARYLESVIRFPNGLESLPSELAQGRPI